MKNVGVMGDFHIGSEYGLNHPKYVSPDAVESTDCMMLYERWCEVRDWFGKLDVALILGDVCDGWNPKEHGDDRNATEEKQVEIATVLLKELKGSPKFYVVEGTGYHTGSRKLDETVADKIGGIQHPHYLTTAPPMFDVKVEKAQFNISHNISVSKSSWQYQTTPIAREQVLAILNDNLANIVLRGHAHYFVYAGYTDHFGAVCPGFQTKTPFQGRISPLGEYRIGALKFQVNGDGYHWDKKIWKTFPSVMVA